MNKKLRYPALLLIFFLALNCAGLLLRQQFKLKYSPDDLFELSLAFAAISVLTLFIYLRGRAREEKEQVMHTLVAISTKFLAELVLLLIWFVVAKKTSGTYVILFFVLYLSFSMLSIGFILKTLKKKSL
jgi:hypothetical protein